MWITRDTAQGEEPDILMLHEKKPELVKGSWSDGVECMPIPEMKRGERVNLRWPK